jgi:twitching motility protein PilT
VLSTLHTIDAVETVNRIIDFFPPHHHQQVRAMLAGSLRGVISQRLVPTVDKEGRAPALEILTMTGRVRDLILKPDETAKLSEVIAEGSYYGMQTFDQALLTLYQKGRISMDEALKAATHPHDFKLLVAAEGQRSTSVEQIYSAEHSKNVPPPAPDEGEAPAAAGAGNSSPHFNS